MNLSTRYWITKKEKVAIERAKRRIIGIENSWKTHNKIERKPEEKTVMYKVEISAKVYVFYMWWLFNLRYLLWYCDDFSINIIDISMLDIDYA
jgi:hypothetical protein